MSLQLKLSETLSSLPAMAATGWSVEMALGIAGLVIGLVGLAGLISLWSSVSVEPLPPIDPKQPFSVPFKITNSGYLPIKHVRPVCYAHFVRIGTDTFARNLLRNKNWNAEHVARGESITIVTNLIHSAAVPAEADIAIVVHFNPSGMPFKTMRRVARFVGHFGKTWQWLKQPSHPIRASIDESLARWAQNT